MSTISVPEAPRRDALEDCVQTLRRLITFRLDPAIDQCMQKLGEQKAFLSEEEHAELLAWVAFAEQRSVERMQVRFLTSWV
jgi:hypothetical protein